MIEKIDILVVEDNGHLVRLIIEELCKLFGCGPVGTAAAEGVTILAYEAVHIGFVKTYDTGLAAIERYAPPVLFMDWDLGESFPRDGSKLAEYALKNDKAREIVCITGKEPGQMPRAIGNGFPEAQRDFVRGKISEVESTPGRLGYGKDPLNIVLRLIEVAGALAREAVVGAVPRAAEKAPEHG